MNSIFEWYDGILVQAMNEGALLLVDEISLANDSVLERLNSVFESDRKLLLAEKPNSTSIEVVAQDKFRVVATMNPSGDFGKKELSPALRNRMTEIWIDSYFNQPHLTEFLSKTEPMWSSLPENIDLYQIIRDRIGAN